MIVQLPQSIESLFQDRLDGIVIGLRMVHANSIPHYSKACFEQFDSRLHALSRGHRPRPADLLDVNRIGQFFDLLFVHEPGAF